VFDVVTPTLTAYLPEASKRTGTAIIIAPGGGFTMLMLDKEGIDEARWLQSRGIASFVLKYRLSETPADRTAAGARQQALAGRPPSGATGGAPPAMNPVIELAVADGVQALKLVRQHTAEWGIDPGRIGFMGFSAGGMLAAGVLLQNNIMNRPDFAALIYGSPSGQTPNIPEKLPPVFLAAAQNDSLMGDATVRFSSALKAAGYLPELHVYSGGRHGFGSRTLGTTSDHWLEEFYYWLDVQGLTKAARSTPSPN
jgi:acetyl esterase/lipase